MRATPQPRQSAATPEGPYGGLIGRIADAHGLDPDLVRAVIRAESNFDPLALSRKGAQGLMQLMPGTAARFAVADPFDPRENIRGGVQYLRRLLEEFAGRLPLVLAAYNAGENAVRRYGDIPPFAETQRYVARVLEYYGRSAEAPDAASSAPRPSALRPAPLARESAPPPAPALYRSVAEDGTLVISNLPPTSRSPVAAQR